VHDGVALDDQRDEPRADGQRPQGGGRGNEVETQVETSAQKSQKIIKEYLNDRIEAIGLCKVDRLIFSCRNLNNTHIRTPLT
jgi:hypothetical protein